MVSPRRPRVSFAWRESNFRLARPRRISRPGTARPPTGTAFFAWHRWDVGLTIAGFVLGAIGTWLAVWATNEYFRPRIELQDRELISHPLASAFRISNRGNVAALWPWIKCTSVVLDDGSETTGRLSAMARRALRRPERRLMNCPREMV